MVVLILKYVFFTLQNICTKTTKEWKANWTAVKSSDPWILSRVFDKEIFVRKARHLHVWVLFQTFDYHMWWINAWLYQINFVQNMTMSYVTIFVFFKMIYYAMIVIAISCLSGMCNYVHVLQSRYWWAYISRWKFRAVFQVVWFFSLKEYFQYMYIAHFKYTQLWQGD